MTLTPILKTFRVIEAVSINTIKEAVRSKVFGSMFFFGVIMILSSIILGEMSLHNERRVAYDVTLFSSTIFAILISIYTSITLFYTEFERRTIYTILTKPLPKWQFLLGKYLGIEVLTLITLAFMFAISCLALKIQNIDIEASLLLAFFTLYLQTLIITAFAHLFSVIAAPLLAGLSAFILFLCGNLFSQLKIIQNMLNESQNPLEHLISLLRVLLPNLESLNLSKEIVYQTSIPSSYFMNATFYALTYTAIILIIAIFIFEARETH